MDIKGYKYIQHRIINRPWGTECQFTVVDNGGNQINAVIPLKEKESPDEKSIAISITAYLQLLPDTTENKVERMYSETEVKNMFVEKGYITADKSINDVPTKAMLIADKEMVK
jgi:hypothetical protein